MFRNRTYYENRIHKLQESKNPSNFNLIKKLERKLRALDGKEARSNENS